MDERSTDRTANKKFSKQELEKRKEMEQDRKAGVGPLIVDDDGRGMQIQVPRFISKTPWYVTHQTNSKDYTEQQKSDIYEATQQRISIQSTNKYREGACENCGSIAHKTKECLERPRKIGARYTGPIAVVDEVVEEKEMSFDTKRDRWKNYDPSDYQQVIEDWKSVEQEQTSTNEQNATGEQSGAILGQKVDLSSSATRMTVRNLRMREDTAKYLLNLKDCSSNYDPKTRAMRTNVSITEGEADFVGASFVKPSLEQNEMKDMRMFAWECQKVGETDVHMQANPTLAESKFKEHLQQKETKKKSIQQALLEKYGGQTNEAGGSVD